MAKSKLKLGSECPQCGAIMGLEESDWNKCGSCGYPDEIIDDEDLDDADEMDEVDEYT